MKKNSFILWIACFVIFFLTVYIYRITDNNYPITSTFGIEGKKVSYRFEKVHYGKNSFEFLLRTDIDSLRGKIFWKNVKDKDWKTSALIDSGAVLKGIIPPQRVNDKVFYYIELSYKNINYLVPGNQKVELQFYGKIPIAVEVLRSILLYLGLLLAVRTGLEFFNENINAKKFSVLTVLSFLVFTVLVNPLYLTYKFGYMNSSIPSIDKLFPASFILILILWIATMILLFTKKKFSYISILTAVLTIILLIVLV